MGLYVGVCGVGHVVSCWKRPWLGTVAVAWALADIRGPMGMSLGVKSSEVYEEQTRIAWGWKEGW